MKATPTGPDHAVELAFLANDCPKFVFVPVVGDDSRLMAIQKRLREVAYDLGLRWSEPDEFDDFEKGVLKALDAPSYGRRKVLWAQAKDPEALSRLLPQLDKARLTLEAKSSTVLLLAVSAQAYVHEVVERAPNLLKIRQALWV